MLKLCCPFLLQLFMYLTISSTNFKLNLQLSWEGFYFIFVVKQMFSKINNLDCKGLSFLLT